MDEFTLDLPSTLYLPSMPDSMDEFTLDSPSALDLPSTPDTPNKPDWPN